MAENQGSPAADTPKPQGPAGSPPTAPTASPRPHNTADLEPAAILPDVAAKPEPNPMAPASGRRLRGQQSELSAKPPQVVIDSNALAVAMLAAQAQAAMISRNMARTEGLDETIPGGAYIVNGVLVNAHGEPVDEDYYERYAKKDD